MVLFKASESNDPEEFIQKLQLWGHETQFYPIRKMETKTMSGSSCKRNTSNSTKKYVCTISELPNIDQRNNVVQKLLTDF